MRALEVEPGAVSPEAYRRFVQQVQRQGLIPDHLVHGEPYLALNAVVLKSAEVAKLRALTECFAAAFACAAASLARNPSELVNMGFPWVAAELLANESPRTLLIGRFDFVCDESGRWWLLEFNADTPSGVREATVADGLVFSMLPSARQLMQPSAGLLDSIASAFRDACADLGPGSALGLLTNAGELEDMAQMAFMRRLLTPALAHSGVEVVVGDIDNLRWTHGGITLCGRRLGALYRCLPFETMLGTPAFAGIFDASASGSLRLLNGLGGLLQQHKGVMAWMYAHANDEGLFDDGQREAILGHLPETWPIGAEHNAYDRDALVAKQVFGREGEEVFFGEDTPEDAWETLQQRRTYVAQRRVNVQAVDGVVQTSSGAAVMRGYVTVGCFIVNGRWGGFYSRFGGKITTSQAKWFATLAEGT
ncbi:MAG: synth protein [Chloroflexi bacterium]|nr:synth protein [Chloroflexota bacterium]